MPDNILMVLDDIPDPLDILEREVIHPDNIAKQIRIQRASLLSQTNIFGLQVQRWTMRHVDLELYHKLKRHLAATQDEIVQFRLRITDNTPKIITAILPTIDGSHLDRYFQQVMFGHLLRLYLASIRKRMRQLKNRCKSIENELASIKEDAEKLVEINLTIEAFEQAQLEIKREMETKRKLAKEAEYFAQIIKGEWERRESCHHTEYDNRQRPYKILPEFDTVDLTATTVWFKIKTGIKGWFGYKPALPGSVTVEALTSDSVVLNASVAANRPMSAVVINGVGAFIRVDRLGVIGGLPELVKYADIKHFYPDEFHERIPICLGVGLDAQLQYLNLADFPHYLIAGFTGSGKSNEVNCIITQLIENNTPEELRLAMIDMKGGLEFSHYEGIPHLLGNIIEKIEGVADYLGKLEKEMEDRFEIMKSRMSKKIEVYNGRVSRENRIPRIAVFFDEVATLAGQGQHTQRVIDSLAQLTAKGRAVGIHIFLCTQHPSVDIIKGHIKTNLTVRLSGRMPTSSSSVTVLGTKDASDLDAVPGRMVLMIGPDPQPIQTPYISDEDIAAAIRKAQEYTKPEYALPESGKAHQIWTPQRIAELAIKHLDGNVSYTVIYKNTELSTGQARQLCEELYALDSVEIDGKKYRMEVKKRGRKQLVEIGLDS